MANLSSTAKSIITLLSNIEDLIVISQKRQEARDVMRATVVYADNKDFPLPKDKVNHFYATLIDSRPLVLSACLKDMVYDVMKTDSLRNSSSKK